VILGAIWLAWQGLIRRRGTRTIEGTIWMVVACAAAIWLIGRPADFTGMGTDVSNGISQSLNTAFAKLPAPTQSNCLPVGPNDPQVQPANFNYSSGGGIVAENANELWSVLVCKPWLAGEFGTTAFGPPGAQTPVNTYGRQLLWAQAIATNETPTNALIQAKQATYAGIATSIQQKDPGIYPLFQGKEWTTRLEIGFAALFAAAIAGVLVLLIAVTLILLKLGFLLLLVVGPFFLLIGTHPGFGRVVAVRWFEMLVGVLLKQAAVALVLSILLYAYSLIMGTSDAVLPWALKILMIALVTIAVFIYRRPFQHLFSAVGYGMIGSTERAEIDMRRYRTTLRDNTLGMAAAAVPGLAAYRAARWARRNPAQAAALAGTSGGAVGAAATAGGPAADGAAVNAEDAAAADGAGAGIAPAEGGTRVGSRAGLASRARAWAGSATADGARRSAPPLNLPPRENAGPAAGRGTSAAAGPGRTAADAAAVAAGAGAGHAGAPPPRPGASGPLRMRPGAPHPAQAPPAPAGSVPAAPPRAAAAPAGPSRATPAPGSAPAAPARAAGPAAAPASPAPAGPPSWPSGSGWPWRPGVTSRPAQRPPSAPSAAPGSAPAAPSGRSQGGPWADSSAGRHSAAPARSPARPAAPGPARPPAAPSPHPPAAPSAGPAAPSSGRSSAGPAAPSSGRSSAGPAGRRSAPPPGRQAAAPSGRSSAPPPARAPAAPAPGRRNPSDREGGSWFGSPAGRQGATPPRQPAAPPGREPSRDGATARLPLSGRREAEPPDGPFWLRPMRRRK
jgi:TrbL/VirB6 plasmid conjugal transfer protein